jgi:hypothetical protein
MSKFTIDAVASSNDDELFKLIGKELGKRISADRNSPEFLSEIKDLPVGLRAMAATYELDVSLALDDFGWHFGNWHSHELADETAKGLHELGATEMADLFRQAYELVKKHWLELGSKEWMEWYQSSILAKAMSPLNDRAWDLQTKKGILKYWIDYARRHPDRIGIAEEN